LIVPPILSRSTREALDRLRETDALGAGDPLERLAGIRTLITALEEDPAALHAVRDALSSGASWEDIAAAAGLKPAAAKWRWQGSDAQIAARHEAGRKRSARPSSVPTDLPGHSVTEAAHRLGVSPQAVYLRISRGALESRTVRLPDGRAYKRVFLEPEPLDTER
jgi:transposase-like protein